jgi:hypothetical protein
MITLKGQDLYEETPVKDETAIAVLAISLPFFRRRAAFPGWPVALPSDLS